MRKSLIGVLLGMFLARAGAPALADPAVGEPPEILLGNRFFDETRFAQFFWARTGGDVNALLAAGDAVMAVTETLHGPLPGPFAGRSMNCRACHMDIEHKGMPGGGGRNYSDFARRSPIPMRAEDGLRLTVRNSQHLVNATLARGEGFALHFDAEFATLEDLVKETLTGRNFGWLPDERDIAVAHIAKVVREDSGKDPLALSFGGGSYTGNLRGTDPLFPTGLPLPTQMTVGVETLSDEQVLDVVARFIGEYVRSLVASQDETGAFNGSPYDMFLRKNGLPTQPRGKEPSARYGKRLRKLVERLEQPAFVSEADGHFQLHDQEFRFGPQELQGLRVFLTARQVAKRGQPRGGGVGNCVACHPPPVFTDSLFHNTGVSQEEYDGIHGAGSFAVLDVPDLRTRNAEPERYLPASRLHPRAAGPFRAVPALGSPGRVDLGLWNVFENPHIGDDRRHAALRRAVCRAIGQKACRRARRRASGLLDATIAAFKTPGLRDLGHAEPYMHNGGQDTLEGVVEFYARTSTLARAGQLRNAPAQLRRMAVAAEDVAPLAAFLRALNEDFE
jgi:cytochrome c peroxidase